MNLNKMIKNLLDIAVTLDSENLMGDAAYLLDIREQLTPRSMEELEPEDGKLCLVFRNGISYLLAKYNKSMDVFMDGESIYKSESFKWLPAPVWKEDE